MRILLTFTALFFSIAFLQFSAGVLSPLDALTGLAAGFSKAQVGFLGSAHFIGFVFGCWWAPRLLGNVGHARAFAAFVALGAVGMAAHVLAVNPHWWALFRVAGGICVAGCYTVIEAWLQAKVTNETRGRAMGVYRIVDISASFIAQFIVGVLVDLPTYVAYNTVTILCCMAILPFGLTTAEQPPVPPAPRLRPFFAWNKSPLATAAVIVSALTASSFRMVGPIYGQETGLTPDQIGYFLACFVAGGAAAQLPIGIIADRFDRRWVLIWLSVAATIACALVVASGLLGVAGVLAASVLFGFVTFPIYSVAASHAHDFASSEERVELSAALMFSYGMGAVAAPWATSSLIELLGPASLFVVLAIGHVVLIGFGLARMRVRPVSATRTPYVTTPRNSFLIGRLLGKQRDMK